MTAKISNAGLPTIDKTHGYTWSHVSGSIRWAKVPKFHCLKLSLMRKTVNSPDDFTESANRFHITAGAAEAKAPRAKSATVRAAFLIVDLPTSDNRSHEPIRAKKTKSVVILIAPATAPKAAAKTRSRPDCSRNQRIHSRLIANPHAVAAYSMRKAVDHTIP